MTVNGSPRPIVLCVLDGWGHRTDQADNAIALADTPVWDGLIARWPHALVETSGPAVGLPAGQMGNSEVGHMNIGAGRIVMQDLPRIDAAIADGSLAENAALKAHISALKESGGACHLCGLLSPGGVHAHQDHIAALARIVGAAGIPVSVHAFLDGRDTPPSSAGAALAAFERAVADVPNVRLASLSGRYYAMDRDNRWDRVARAYDAVMGSGVAVETASEALRRSYDAGVTDEFVEPVVIGAYAGARDGDGLLMANFRADRAREILLALLDPGFTGFDRSRVVHFASALGMCAYSEALDRLMSVLFAPARLTDTLADAVARHGLTQLRIAETEKYAHVTFFLNGGDEREHEGETRILVPSPKVATYDLEPAMSAEGVTDRLVDAIRSARFDFIVVNYANTDMVGHTGILSAAIEAVEAVDRCLGRLVDAVDAAGGLMLITADHGNAEMMREAGSGTPHTAHTHNPVPIVLIGRDGVSLADGRLCDVAPTLLSLMGLDQPAAMTGRSLLVPQPRGAHRGTRVASA